MSEMEAMILAKLFLITSFLENLSGLPAKSEPYSRCSW